MKNLIYFVLMATVSVASTYGQNMNTKDQALETTLERFAADHGLSGKEMTAMLAKYLFDQPLFSKKANLGVVDASTQVDLGGSKNRLLFENGNRIWEGRSREQTEVVVLVRQAESLRLLKDIEMPTGGVVLIKFTPDKVQIMDVEKGSGGFYDRAPTAPAAAK